MKIKIILQFLTTLALGFMLGFMSHSYVTSQKIKNYSWGRGESMFWQRALVQIDATDQQKEKILPIVRRYSEEGHRLMSDNFKKIEPIWDKMNAEIRPLLTDKQRTEIEKLKAERAKKFRERTRKPDRNNSKNGRQHERKKK